jgi:hypothetical protein
MRVPTDRASIAWRLNVVRHADTPMTAIGRLSAASYAQHFPPIILDPNIGPTSFFGQFGEAFLTAVPVALLALVRHRALVIDASTVQG